MHFYEVWVRSSRYHGSKPLTYTADEILAIGQIVTIPLRNEKVLGVVVSRTSKTPKVRLKPIEQAIDIPPLPIRTLKLMEWLKEYYPAPIGIITQQFLPPRLPSDNFNVDSSDHKIQTSNLPKLTNEQKQAIQKIDQANTYLIHGRTGSGKTRIYIDLAAESINNNKSVILLTPEISLTTQLEIQFRQVFDSLVVVMHSTLTPKQRASRWVQLINQPGPKIVIGPRSAIFAPLEDIGLIIIDEEHEPAYKQEQSPYYVTSRVASQLRIIHQAKLILGSATPLVTDYYLAKGRNKPIIRLTELAQEKSSTTMNALIVDHKDKTQFSRSSYLSDKLINLIDESLSEKTQTLLYLNRRGTARVIICDNCGWQAKCPRCDLPLTYHGDNHTLRCHVCGYAATGPVTCPECKKPSVKYLSIGTKAVVDEVKKIFPTARIERFDADNLKAERIEQRYNEIKQGNVDIIVGTQMLAKGLDLPKLKVVGVMLADTSLQLPDYTVNERTYQLLQQVIGRVGRGHVDGYAVIQTYQPDNSVITDAVKDNWDNFYAREIEERKDFNFPPFTHMLKLTVKRASSKNAETTAIKLSKTIPKNLVVEGPAPAFHEKLGNSYRWQLVVKAKNRGDLLRLIATLPAKWSYDIDPSDLI